MEKLKQMPIWVCCKIVDVNGRKTKIPCAAGGGSTGTSKEYAHTWVTYDEAMEVMKRHGYVVPTEVLSPQHIVMYVHPTKTQLGLCCAY